MPRTAPIRVADLHLRGRHGPIPARVHWPRPGEGRPPLVIRFCRVLGAAARHDDAVVITVRAPLAEAQRVLEWAAGHAEQLGASTRLLVAGANAATIVRQARQAGWPPAELLPDEELHIEEIAMRKIIASFNMSLDGDTDHMEEWHFQYFRKDAEDFARDQLFACDALLMGRRTYEGFAQAWPDMEEETGEFGVRMNNLPHYVVSATLAEDKATWNNTTIIRDNVLDEVAKLKEQPGRDILMYGYGPLAHALLKGGLLDEIRVWLHPVLSGHGEPEALLFRDGTNIPLDLAATQQLDTGVLILTYRPATVAPAA